MIVISSFITASVSALIIGQCSAFRCARHSGMRHLKAFQSTATVSFRVKRKLSQAPCNRSRQVNGSFVSFHGGSSTGGTARSFLFGSSGDSNAGGELRDDGTSRPARPDVIVFDLDGALWRPEMYELIWFGGGGAPFRPDPNDGNTMLTRGGEPVSLLGDVRDVMRELHVDDTGFWDGTRVGISSRTDEPDWALELLQKFEIEDGRGGTFALADVFDFREIGKDSKVRHFERISDAAGVPMTSILFFDNEAGNCRDVASLGVTAVFCPEGITREIWQLGVRSFPSTSGEVVGLDIYGLVKGL